MVTFKFGEINVKVDEQYLDDFQYFAENALYHLENEGRFRNPIKELQLSHLEDALASQIEYMEADKEDWLSGFADEYNQEDAAESYNCTLEHFKSLISVFEAASEHEVPMDKFRNEFEFGNLSTLLSENQIGILDFLCDDIDRRKCANERGLSLYDRLIEEIDYIESEAVRMMLDVNDQEFSFREKMGFPRHLAMHRDMLPIASKFI